MKFDVIIGNPPYQESDEGNGASAKALYDAFVDSARRLNPKYISMIIPARWYAGGKGLDTFRDSMLHDRRIRILHDYSIGSDCFPNTRISGGVCYFLWDRDSTGDCDVISHKNNTITSKMVRPLLEEGNDTFIRINEAISIYRKVQAFNETSFSTIVSSRKPYGLATDFLADPEKYGLPKIQNEKKENCIEVIGKSNNKVITKYVDANYPIPEGVQYINKYKVFVSQVLDNHLDWTNERLKPFLGKPGTICTETYLRIGCYDNEEIANNVISYMNTKFFHLMMFLRKVSHHVTAKVYQLVPLQDFNKSWTDIELYTKYGLTQEEIDFIESEIRSIE